MDKVKYYYISGVGNIFAFELGVYEKVTQIAWPAVAINVPNPRNPNEVLLTMNNFVPEFLVDYSNVNKNLSISNNLIIINSSVNSHLEEVYTNWQREAQRKATGILVPEMKPRRGLVQ